MTEQKPCTHIAYALRREGRRTGRWLEIGIARIESDSSNGHHVYLNRLPIGGFSGHVYLLPLGVKPDDPPPAPVRPKTAQPLSDDEEEF